VTGRGVYRKPFEPLLPDVRFLPYDDVKGLEGIDRNTAAVIAEPIQGEGGVRVPSSQWIRALRERCTRVGALLIFDEIQTGFGRTGHLFAFQGSSVVPDIMTVAKAMGGGMPLGAFISSADIMACLRREPPLAHVTTFGGHPVSCAAGVATLRTLLAEDLPGRARWIEKRICSALRHHAITEVRGRGAMLGMQLAEGFPVAAFVDLCLSRGVLLGWTLHSDTLVRLAPPLNIDEEVLAEALMIIIESLDAAEPHT
jgi:acetylornithine/succinyldiaminopimelate/putrescine aminotransferase